MLKSQEVALDLAAFLEVAGKCLQGRQHTPIKKKKKRGNLPGHGVSLLPARSPQHIP